MASEATTRISGRQSMVPADRRVLVGAAIAVLFLAKLAATWFFHKYDWDILEIVFLPLVHGQPVEDDPYSFLLSSLLGFIGGKTGGVPGFDLLMVVSELLYFASGILIFRIAEKWTGSRPAAVVGAAVFLSCYCIIYVSAYLDDNVFQVFFVVLALWALLRDKPRVALAAVCYGLSCAFHLQSFALAPAYAVGVWTLASGTRIERARSLALAVGLVVLVYGGLLLAIVNVGDLWNVISGAATRGPGAFVVSRDHAGLMELLARGIVATLLPFPIHIRAVFDHPTLYLTLIGAGLIYIAGALALAASTFFRANRSGGGLGWLATAMTGFWMGVLFALLAEPDGTERWVSVAPFFALIVSAAVARLVWFRSRTAAATGQWVVSALAFALVLFTAFPGKVLAFALFGGERQVVTSGMIESLASTFARTDLVVLDEGFEALSLYRPQRTCYTVFEYWTDNIKCWGPEGVTHRRRSDPGYLNGQRTIAMQIGLPDLDADLIVDGDIVQVCDPSLLARAFGRGRCVPMRVGTIR